MPVDWRGLDHEFDDYVRTHGAMPIDDPQDELCGGGVPEIVEISNPRRTGKTVAYRKSIDPYLEHDGLTIQPWTREDEAKERAKSVQPSNWSLKEAGPTELTTLLAKAEDNKAQAEEIERRRLKELMGKQPGDDNPMIRDDQLIGQLYQLNEELKTELSATLIAKISAEVDLEFAKREIRLLLEALNARDSEISELANKFSELAQDERVTEHSLEPGYSPGLVIPTD